MMSTQAPETTREIELQAAEELERIPGVLAASVWLGEASQVREIYIAAAPHASMPILQQAAADVLRRSGLGFSPGAIQIGQIDEVATTAPARDEANSSSPWQSRFLIMNGIDIHRTGNQVTCKVQLIRLGDTFDGECRELDTETGRARAAARATLAAAEKAASSARLGLEGAILLDLFGRKYVVVSVEATAGRRFGHLSGILASDSTRSIEEAACLATLRAIERWIAW
jgi:hypothetical protein